jgi:hypothetical protein
MANQTTKPDPIDIADERGKIAPGQLAGDDAIAPGSGIDEVGIDESSSDAPPTPDTRTPGTALGDLADPDADANFPDPSKPISMNAGPQPARGRNIPAGGYGDSRDAGDRGDRAMM